MMGHRHDECPILAIGYENVELGFMQVPPLIFGNDPIRLMNWEDYMTNKIRRPTDNARSLQTEEMQRIELIHHSSRRMTRPREDPRVGDNHSGTDQLPNIYKFRDGSATGKITHSQCRISH